MKILGISNPNFIGVSAATRAIVTDYLPIAHQHGGEAIATIARQIVALNPDILIIGGWSIGYDWLVKEMKRTRKFPVMCVYHGTHFHGEAFGDDSYLSIIAACQVRGEIDYMGYVQPQTAEYYQTVHDQVVAWVPHSFKQQIKAKESPHYKIGVFGGTKNWYKNTGGVLKVAQDFCDKHRGSSIITQLSYDKPRTEFHDLLKSCSVIIHTSHLECYSNTIQEAWSYGVPAIMSWANVGLINNPLFTHEEKQMLERMTVLSNIDPLELYEKLRTIKSQWGFLSTYVHSLSGRLSQRTVSYTHDLFNAIVMGYKSSKPPLARFQSPFRNPESYTGDK